MCSFGVRVLLMMLVAAFVSNGRCDDDASAEANLFALEASGQLLPPESLKQKFADALQKIRAAHPAVSDIVNQPPWVAGELLAKVSDEQVEQIRSQYGEVTSEPLFDLYKKLTFTTKYNPEVLAKELNSKKLVTYAEPNNIIGRSNRIQYQAETGVYTFHHGWGDCPSGCIKNHHWEFSVTPSKGVELLKEYGAPLEAVEGF